MCGAIPRISDIADVDENSDHEYKLFCSNCGVHNSIGDWFKNKYKACKDWNRRQVESKDGEQSGEKNLGDKLKRCPFCGRKMVFRKETYVNKHGKQVTSQYYMHEEYDMYKEEQCILDEINMPFTLGAGDANPDTGYIGEYGEKWNEQLKKGKVF